MTVTFSGDVLVWNLQATLGDSPACSIGTPVALGDPSNSNSENSENNEPLHVKLQELSEEQDERYAAVMVNRKQKRAKQQRTARGPPVSKLNYYQRIERLKHAGISEQDIKTREQDVNKWRRQRTWASKTAGPMRFVITFRIGFSKAVGKMSVRHRNKLVQEWYAFYGKQG